MRGRPGTCSGTCRAPRLSLTRGRSPTSSTRRSWSRAPRAVFGEKLIQMYGKPCRSTRTGSTAVGAESHIDLGGATLTTLHAPGHAPHQISVLFEEEHLLFSADAVGIVFPAFPTLDPDDPSSQPGPGEARADPRDAASDRPEDAPRPALRGHGRTSTWSSTGRRRRPRSGSRR